MLSPNSVYSVSASLQSIPRPGLVGVHGCPSPSTIDTTLACDLVTSIGCRPRPLNPPRAGPRFSISPVHPIQPAPGVTSCCAAKWALRVYLFFARCALCKSFAYSSKYKHGGSARRKAKEVLSRYASACPATLAGSPAFKTKCFTSLHRCVWFDPFECPQVAASVSAQTVLGFDRLVDPDGPFSQHCSLL